MRRSSIERIWAATRWPSRDTPELATRTVAAVDQLRSAAQRLAQRLDEFLTAQGQRRRATPAHDEAIMEQARIHASTWLIADWDNPIHSAARFTDRSSNSASSGTRRLRLTEARRSSPE